MFALVISIHVIVCAMLILIVMIQQGRGGGLIDTFSSAESIFGTKTSAFLVKSTSILAVIFFVTCLALAFLSIQKSRSLVEREYKPSQTQAVTPVEPVKENAPAAEIAGENAPTATPEANAVTQNAQPSEPAKQ
ncbi:MAG: preprotein translocase subunit SecG [Candidatus Omnitrophota bacterium]